MMQALSRLLGVIASLRLTIICLAAAFVLVFVGTLAQVYHGVFFIQKEYFQSWFVMWSATPEGFRVPIFPGGHLVGAVLLVNLIAAHIRRFSWTWRKLGIQLVHLGLIIMLAGGLATDLCSVSSYMRLKQGETKNYSEDDTRMELALIAPQASDNDQVVVIPAESLADEGVITNASLPFKVVVKKNFPNSELKMIGEQNAAAVPAAANGAGARISVKAAALNTQPNGHDKTSAVVEIIPTKGGKSLGTWLVSSELVEAQNFEVDAKPWNMQLRPARYYKPYSLSLISFTHQTYPGTDIPNDFSSKVTLTDADHNVNRQVKIYMNNPLRYCGDTYYQSGFEPDNSGTVLQVVRNPSYQAPYVACVIVSIGLLIQFTYHLTGFARRAITAAAP